MIGVINPPAVSIPIDKDATSNKRRSWIFSEVSPARMAALYSSTTDDGFFGIDGFVGFFSVEEIGNELLNTRNPSGAPNEDEFCDGLFVHFCVAEDLLD